MLVEAYVNDTTHGELYVALRIQIDGCEGSGLFHAFSKHILHRLRVNQTGPLLNSVRVTLLSRSTNFRRIVNENEVSLLRCILKSFINVSLQQSSACKIIYSLYTVIFHHISKSTSVYFLSHMMLNYFTS